MIPGDTKRPRLLLVVNVSWFFLSHRLPLAKAALRAGYDVHVATRVISSRDARQIQDAGLVLHHIEIGRGESGLLYDLRSMLLLNRLFSKLQPDLVHLVAMKPVVFGGMIARLRRMRRVVLAVPGLGYGFVGRGLAGRARRMALMVMLRMACRWSGASVILQNKEDLQALVNAGVVRDEATVLIRGSGVAVAAIERRPEPDGPVRVVLASRMLREKGIEEFVEASRQIRDRRPGVEFLLAGDPDPSNPGSITKAQLTSWDASGVVRYLGFVDNITDLFLSSNVVCLPTYYGEGVPKVLIEAAACGRPIVTTDRPGCRDIVKEGVNGILVPPRDPMMLAQALARLIDNPELRALYGNAGRVRAEQEFDLSIIVGQTLDLYRRLLSRPCASS